MLIQSERVAEPTSSYVHLPRVPCVEPGHRWARPDEVWAGDGGRGARRGPERECDRGAADVVIGDCSQRGSDGREVASREPAAESRLHCYLGVWSPERSGFECPGESLADVRRQGDERLDHAGPVAGKNAASGTASVGTTSARSSRSLRISHEVSAMRAHP